MHIFLDESGQFNKHDHEEHFVIGSFTVDDQRKTAKEFRKWHRTKFSRKMRYQNEIKWSDSGITNDLRLQTLKHIARLNIGIRFGYVLKKDIPSSYLDRKNRIDSGILYTNMVAQLLERYLPTDNKEIRAFCDKRSLKGMTRQEFEDSVVDRLTPFCYSDSLLKVGMIDSASNANIQIADWICGAVSYYLEQKPLGEECFAILQNKFLSEGIKFFKD